MSEGYPISEEAKTRMREALPEPSTVVEDLSELAGRMELIRQAAPGVDLAHLRFGLRAYQRVTERVTEEAEAGHFDDPEKMMRTMPRFAKRIFDPIEQHTLGHPERVGPWSKMFYSQAARDALPSTSMVDFLGFHVLYDLPYTLHETDTKPQHKLDYSRRINSILRDVGDELLPEYIQLHPTLEKARLNELGLTATMWHLIVSRDLAWRSFKMIEMSEKWPVKNRLYDHSSLLSRGIDRNLGRVAAATMLSTKRPVATMLRRISKVPEEYWGLDQPVVREIMEIEETFPIAETPLASRNDKFLDEV